MKTIRNGVIKFFLANLAVLIIIAMLPVFLVTDHVPLYNVMIDYLFSNNKH